MKKHAIQYLEEAAAKLEDLDGILDRARDNAEEFHDEAERLQADVYRATRRAIDLVRRIKGEPTD